MEIILCDKCKGLGYIETSERVSAYESEFFKAKCYKCEGSGRLEKTIIYKPHKSHY